MVIREAKTLSRLDFKQCLPTVTEEKAEHNGHIGRHIKKIHLGSNLDSIIELDGLENIT